MFQTRPVVLCMTATLDDIIETTTLNLLGISANVKRINVNPINPRISFINCLGTLNINFIKSLLVSGECPRIIMFKTSIVQCGLLYLEIRKVSKSLFMNKISKNVIGRLLIKLVVSRFHQLSKLINGYHLRFLNLVSLQILKWHHISKIFISREGSDRKCSGK